MGVNSRMTSKRSLKKPWLFRVDELKAEQRLIVEEIATGRDVFADRLRQNFNFSTVAWGIKLLESLRL